MLEASGQRPPNRFANSSFLNFGPFIFMCFHIDGTGDHGAVDGTGDHCRPRLEVQRARLEFQRARLEFQNAQFLCVLHWNAQFLCVLHVRWPMERGTQMAHGRGTLRAMTEKRKQVVILWGAAWPTTCLYNKLKSKNVSNLIRNSKGLKFATPRLGSPSLDL